MVNDEQSINWQRVRRRVGELEQTLEEELTDHQRCELLAQRAERYRHEETRHTGETIDLVVFVRHGHRYAAPLDDLEEIRRAGNFQPVPGVSSVVAGVINVRGQIVTIHDLAAFQGQKAPVDDDKWVVVGRGRGTALALVADTVEGVESPSREAIRAVPLSLDSDHGEFQGVLHDATLVLDFEGLTRSDEFFMA